jgi:transposase
VTYEEFKTSLFLRALEECGWSENQAAKKLDMPQSTFNDWCRKNRELVDKSKTNCVSENIKLKE